MKKLKLPLWSEIIYLMLTVVAPIVFILIEAHKVPSVSFRVTFTVCTTALMAYIMIRKFIINKWVEKLSNQCAIVELNYQTGVGDPEKNKTVWVKNKIIEYSCNIIQVVLFGVLVLLIVWGLQSLGLKLKGTTLFICILYLIAFTFRIIMYMSRIVNKNNSNEDSVNQQK